MSSSENEEFESADEDYRESPKKITEAKVATKDDTAKQLTNPTKTAEVEESGKLSKPAEEKRENLNKNKVEEAITEADGWEVDDWGDGDEEPKKDDQILDEAEGVEDGWSDFDDDWGDDEPSDKKREQNMNAVFPVLDEISTEKQTNTSDNILQNLSKLVGKSETISTYDAFPVLNDLSPTKPRTNCHSIPEEVKNIKTEITDHNKSTAASTSSWGWKPWGGVVSSILSTATEGVTSLTSHVSHGLSTVIESGIGVPDPQELARINKEQTKIRSSEETDSTKKDENIQSKQEEAILPTFGNIVSGVTHIGNKVITGGLDTLEGIGKKTMTILQENDPLLLNKRKMLGLESEKPVLSQILREAKEKSEEIERNLKQMNRNSYKKQLHFETLFDHYYGLVHLEALEMLSKQSNLKLQSLLEPLTGKALAELQETLNEVKELYELGDIENDENDGLYSSEELSSKLTAAVEDLGIQTDFKDILKCWEENIGWLTGEGQKAEPQEIYEKGLRCLAQTCALAIHRYHKIAEMLLIKEHHSTANEADSLVQLTITFCWHLNGIATRFGGKLNSYEQNEEISSLITSVFVEVYNSNSYIQNAFQLFIPILQIGAA